MKYQKLRDELDAGPTPGPWTYKSIDESQFGIRNQAGEVIAQTQQIVGDTLKQDQRHINTRYVATVDPDTLSALLAERDAREQQNKGYEAQHTRDSQELRRLCQARDDARKERDRFSRMFGAACEALGLINEALGLNPDDGGAGPILQAISEIKAECDALREALAQADALVAAHTRPGDDIADAVRAIARAALSQGEQT